MPFLADQATRRIHYRLRSTPDCCLEEIAAEDQLVVDNPDDVLRMVELEGYEPCPTCMARFPWVDD